MRAGPFGNPCEDEAVTTPTAPGWYDDPHQPGQLRYFDGIVWTAHVVPRSTREATPPASAPTQPLPQPPADPYGWGPPQPGPPPADQRPAPGPPSWQQGQPGQQWRGGAAPGVSGPTTPDGVPLASYGQRVGAALLDGLLTGLLVTIFGGWFLWKAMQPWWTEFIRAVETNDTNAMDNLSLNLADTMNGGYFLAYAVVALLVQLAYQVYFLTRDGATPGKKALGISVRLRERPGPLTLVDALRRQLLNIGISLVSLLPGIVSLLGSLVALADVLWPLWDPNRQALHDKIAATNVVRGKQPKRPSA